MQRKNRIRLAAILSAIVFFTEVGTSNLDNTSFGNSNTAFAIGVREQESSQTDESSSDSSSTNSENDTNDSSEQDAGWTDNKDEFRHYNTDKLGFNGGTEMGHAEGEHAVKLEDGTSWYWYHQSGADCGCPYCKDYTGLQLHCSTVKDAGTGGACSEYALAIALANVLGYDLTPTQMWLDAGAKLNDAHTVLDLSPIERKYPGMFQGNAANAWGYDAVEKMVEETYGLEYTQFWSPNWSGDKIADEMKKALDDGCIVYWVYDTAYDGQVYKGDHGGHFNVIRSHIGDEFYFLDSCKIPDSDRWSWFYSHGFTKDEMQKMNAGRGWFCTIKNPNGPQKRDTDKESASQSTSVSPSDSSSVDTEAIENLASRASDVDISNLQRYKSKAWLNSGSMYLYDGLPWGKTSKTKMVDTDAMSIALMNYVMKASGGTPKSKGGGTFTYKDAFGVASGYTYTNVSKLAGSGWKDLDGGKVKTVDGIDCVAVRVPPGLLDSEYNSNFGMPSGTKNYWVNQKESKALNGKLGTMKIALVLKNKNGDITYLPCVLADQQDLSFPGGVADTAIKITSKSVIGDKSVELYGKLMRLTGSNYQYATDDITPDNLMDFMNEEVYGTSKLTSWQCTRNKITILNCPKSIYPKIINNNNSLIGLVRWE